VIIEEETMLILNHFGRELAVGKPTPTLEQCSSAVIELSKLLRIEFTIKKINKPILAVKLTTSFRT
jgi:hypothetical protein